MITSDRDWCAVLEAQAAVEEIVILLRARGGWSVDASWFLSTRLQMISAALHLQGAAVGLPTRRPKVAA